MIFLFDASVEFIHGNIKRRARFGEEKVSKLYLQCIRDGYLDFIKRESDWEKHIQTIHTNDQFIDPDDFYNHYICKCLKK